MSVPRKTWTGAELAVLQQHNCARAAQAALQAAGLPRRPISSVERKVTALEHQRTRAALAQPHQVCLAMDASRPGAPPIEAAYQAAMHTAASVLAINPQE